MKSVLTTLSVLGMILGGGGIFSSIGQEWDAWVFISSGLFLAWGLVCIKYVNDTELIIRSLNSHIDVLEEKIEKKK
ncbi:MAG: hypothetical protein V1928_04615 [Parcubacteria group bacterium]